jgi:hypothetical protein
MSQPQANHYVVDISDSDPSSAICSNAFSAICLCGSLYGLIVAGILQFVYTIIYLIEYWDEANQCSDSNMNAYIIVALIMAYSSAGSAAKTEDLSESMLKICCQSMIGIGFGTWGLVIAFHLTKDCSIYHSNLWTMLLIISLEHFMCLLLIIFIIVYAGRATNE